MHFKQGLIEAIQILYDTHCGIQFNTVSFVLGLDKVEKNSQILLKITELPVKNVTSLNFCVVNSQTIHTIHCFNSCVKRI